MLRLVLLANAAFSTTSALVFLLAADRLAPHVPLPGWAFAGLGLGLLSFAAALSLLALRPALQERWTPDVIQADWAWVALTSLALLVGASHLSGTGIALVLSVNGVVATFALLQGRAYRGMSRTGGVSEA